MARYFEDCQVGEIFPSGSVILSREDIVSFATQYDPQVFHLTPEGGQGSVFGKMVASGWHTASATMRLFVTGPFQLVGGLVGLGVESIKWPRPVLPGDTLSTESQILNVQESRSNPTRGTLKVLITSKNQQGDVVLEMTATLLAHRRPLSPNAVL